MPIFRIDDHDSQRKLIMKERLVAYLLDNFLNEHHVLDLSCLNLSGVDVDLSGLTAQTINNMKQTASNSIFNSYQKAEYIMATDQEYHKKST